MPRRARPGLAAVLGAALLLLGTAAITRDLDPPATPRAPGAGPRATQAEVDAARRQARDEALEKTSEQVARAGAEHGPNSEDLARALADEAFLLWGAEDYAAGRPIAERALAILLAQPQETSWLAGSRYQV